MEKRLGELRHILTVVFLSGFAGFSMRPVMPDVIISAVCSGLEDSCSLAVYLAGLKQVVIGLGAMMMMPIIGNLADKYGIKTMLTLPLFLSIFPPAILGYRKDTNFFYIYYITRVLFGIICDGAVDCLAYAYVAKNIHYEKRTAAFGILAGVSTTSGICGTLAARFLFISSTFQVSAISCVLGLVYMRFFLKERLNDDGNNHQILDDNDIIDSSILRQPILQDESSTTINVFNNYFSSFKDMVYLMRTSDIFVQALLVTFIHSFSQNGMKATISYFLKFQFGYNKNNFADMGLLINIIGSVSQLFLLPTLISLMGEHKVLSIGLLIDFFHLAIFSVAWAAWVPYATTMLVPGVMFVMPSICGIAAKQAGPGDQGKIQGCISGVKSFAGVISPFIYSPLTALFLSEKAPFNFPGFSLLCVALASLIGFFVSLGIKDVHLQSSNNSFEDEV